MNIDPGFINTAKWPVFYEDNHLLVVYKPSGLLIQGDCTGDVCLLDLAREYIRIRYEKPGNVFLALVHRLDRPVAGVVVFARTSKAASRLGRQFRTGRVEKQYLAVVHGVVPGRGGDLVNNMVRKGPTSRIVAASTAKSQEARLSYRVLSTAENKTLLEIELDTGRHHQIRAQLAHLGFPVMGDLRYGAADPMPQKQLALFARKLAFDHPTQKQRMTFCTPLPLGWPWSWTPENPDAPVWDWKSLQA
ncbi:23S rRNA pseudouridine1911/1915/1917 synthase [Desulfosalsimonas propionicica]|uniref:23S rRNA pseudouridine1911/1915/1917 synthase n=1 Tax=Desulfosalsimonas propionicica TaxID=332175 RepID=A0A7W0CB55_9BACT|nr:RNA pseudouridine synthase [Desulfosalsimonas propionicica]MBA2882517.1 23S rRNA pseudouridine1911/1915/1917 synthase [Desulfosalsimonas propionicica]